MWLPVLHTHGLPTVITSTILRAQPCGSLLQHPTSTSEHQSMPHPSLKCLKPGTRRRNKWTSPTQITYVINMSYEGKRWAGKSGTATTYRGDLWRSGAGDKAEVDRQGSTGGRAAQTSTSRKTLKGNILNVASRHSSR